METKSSVVDEIFQDHPHVNRALSEVLRVAHSNSEEDVMRDLLILMNPETNDEKTTTDAFERQFGYDITTHFDKKMVYDFLETVKRFFPKEHDPEIEIGEIAEDVVRVRKDNRPLNFIMEISQVLLDRYSTPVATEILNAIRDMYPDVEYYLNGIDLQDSVDEEEEDDDISPDSEIDESTDE